ncbi:tripartite tricarboxylate transporter TctB family protein [Robertmurraya kyonggiensis]|uniref:Tripartite tricarboxylate transporter TctB family protein n=1 Tax=Robertmurraya kyonggiensis TaxID=1037680 RepID=A0A4U1CXZ6_9BACI|nr:tripartite tricarboxylate transporter TctB family protein [Robertmurraya kyonggiensis]TKC14390.1 tripartite tricarboxylate transporter TctB family protein [Robertmurraya kyonggiensis]
MGIKVISPNRIGAFVAIILGGLSIFEAIRLYPYGNNLLTGDHTFPGMIGVLLILAGGMLLFERKKDEVVLPKGRTAFMMIASIGSLIIYSLSIKYIGYFFSTVLAFLFLIKIIGNYSWIFSIVIATVLTTALYLLFIVLLKTPFPSLLF